MKTIRFIRLFFKMLGTPVSYKGIDHPTLWQGVLLRWCGLIIGNGWCYTVVLMPPNRCYKLAAIYYTETLIEAVKKKNLKKERWK